MSDYLPKIKFLQKYFPKADKSEGTELVTNTIPTEELLEKLTIALALSAFLVAIGMWLAPHVESLLQTELKLDVLLITILVLILANVFPQHLQPLEQVAFQIGMFLLFFFLAVIGATCDVSALLSASPKVLIFAIIMLFFHLAFILLAGKLLKFSLEDIAIASGANVGGVSISAPMAATFEMKKAVTPAILIGIMGYVVGTFLGIGVGLLLK